MKITHRKLKQIIREELNLLREQTREVEMDPVTVIGDVPGSITHDWTDKHSDKIGPVSADRVTVNGKKILIGKMSDLHKWLDLYGVEPGDFSSEFDYVPYVRGKFVPPQDHLKDPTGGRTGTFDSPGASSSTSTDKDVDGIADFEDNVYNGWQRSDGVEYFAMLVPVGCGGFYVPGIEIEPGVPLIIYNNNYVPKSLTRPGMDIYDINNDMVMMAFMNKSDLKNMPAISGCEAGRKYQEDRKPKPPPQEKKIQPQQIDQETSPSIMHPEHGGERFVWGLYKQGGGSPVKIPIISIDNFYNLSSRDKKEIEKFSSMSKTGQDRLLSRHRSRDLEDYE